MTGREQEIDDVIENTSLVYFYIVYNNELKLFNDYIMNNKHGIAAKRISSEKLIKPGLSSIQFPSRETIAKRVKLKPQE